MSCFLVVYGFVSPREIGDGVFCKLFHHFMVFVMMFSDYSFCAGASCLLVLWCECLELGYINSWHMLAHCALNFGRWRCNVRSSTCNSQFCSNSAPGFFDWAHMQKASYHLGRLAVVTSPIV